MANNSIGAFAQNGSNEIGAFEFVSGDRVTVGPFQLAVHVLPVNTYGSFANKSELASGPVARPPDMWWVWDIYRCR